MSVSAVSPFVHQLNTHHETLTRQVMEGRKCIGYFCHTTPVELIHAAGFIPVRISGGPGAVDQAYNLAPDFICPYMKRSLEKALAGKYRFLSGLVQGYTCDAACGMANIWADNIDEELYHILPLPYEDSAESRNYLKAEYQNLIEKLSQVGGNFSESNLSRSINLYSGIRNRVRELHELRMRGKLPLTSEELWQVIQAGHVMEPETYLDLLENLRPELFKLNVPEQGGIPILLSGSLIEAPGVIGFVENLGGRIVADDLCSGMRPAVSFAGNSTDPFEQLCELHFTRFPCPSRSRAEDRFPFLYDLVQQSGARGVVFMLQKFCTPHLCDTPYLTDRFREINIPSVWVELDETWQVDARTGTRLEGLFEVIGD